VLLLHDEIAPSTKFKFRTLTAQLLVCALALCASVPLLADEPMAADQATPANDGGAAEPDAAQSSSRWRVGISVGALSHESLETMLWNPEPPNLHSSYLAVLDGAYTLHRFQVLPMDLEVESAVAHRFGQDHQNEVDLISVLRWKKFPWNDELYTNLRFGFLGGSYVSSISPWEKIDSGNNEGSKFLQLLILELTFAPHENAGYEGFIGLHHRSGIFGLIDGVSGGSNYLIVGMRFRAD
jgi:hypothetical protein